MRNLFLVLAKLFGLLQLYYALIGFMQTVSILLLMRAEVPRQFYVSLVDAILLLAISMGMAWLLLARTEWLANLLKIREEEESVILDKEAMLLVGVKLIGVYVTVRAIPALTSLMQLREVGWIWERRSVASDWRVLSAIISALLELGLGVLLMLQSSRVVGMIAERKTIAQTTDEPGSQEPPKSGS
jgi:hypothetical protein